MRAGKKGGGEKGRGNRLRKKKKGERATYTARIRAANYTLLGRGKKVEGKGKTPTRSVQYLFKGKGEKGGAV